MPKAQMVTTRPTQIGGQRRFDALRRHFEHLRYLDRRGMQRQSRDRQAIERRLEGCQSVVPVAQDRTADAAAQCRPALSARCVANF